MSNKWSEKGAGKGFFAVTEFARSELAPEPSGLDLPRKNAREGAESSAGKTDDTPPEHHEHAGDSGQGRREGHHGLGTNVHLIVSPFKSPGSEAVAVLEALGQANEKIDAGLWN